MLAHTLIPMLLLASLSAQGAYDEFNGSGPIDSRKWYAADPTPGILAGGFLQVRVPANAGAGDLETTYGFDGAFDLQLRYRQLAGTGAVWLGVYDSDPTSPSGDFWIGVVSLPNGQQRIESGSGRITLSTMAAGELRLSRSSTTGGMVAASYRPAGVTAWTTVHTTANPFGSSVQLWIEISGGSQPFTVDFDRLWNGGPGTVPRAPAPAPHPVGIRCHGLDSRAADFPFLGRSTFLLVVMRARSGATVGGVFGTNQPTWNGLLLPVSLGFLGDPSCYLNVSPVVTLPTGTASVEGEYIVPLSIPNQPSLRGRSFSSQFVASDPSTPIGFSFSNGVTFTIL